LYNPRIREFFLNTYFKQLPLALELSFESLPSMIANIPEFKTILKNPVSVFYQIISQVDFRLAEIKIKIDFDQKVFILSGAYQQGKTTQIQKIIEVLKENMISVGGIYSPRIMDNNQTIGYDIVDIVTNEREIFLRQNGDETFATIGRYRIFPQGLKKGSDALKPSSNVSNKIVIIDEAGFLELENHGWASSITELLKASNNHILLVVRDIFVEKVLQKWNLKQAFVLNISENDCQAVSKIVMEQI
jgi:nucleoside-triphosphatase THEP1